MYNDNGMSELGNAIIVQAVDDYRVAMKNIMKAKSEEVKNKAERDIYEIEHFFRSDDYKSLTTLDGEALIERLRKEKIDVNQRRKRYKKVVSEKL